VADLMGGEPTSPTARHNDPSDRDTAVKPVRNAALRCLARREYATQELRQKLIRKYSPDLVADVLGELIEQALLSDQRYAEMLVCSRINRGYGPRYIASELKQKGISAELIDEHLDISAEVWLEQAQQLVAKRLNGRARENEPEMAQASEHKQQEQARQRETAARERVARLLSRRGFPSDVIYKAMA
jgi:regulatory protein